jgi:hypothetical protein
MGNDDFGPQAFLAKNFPKRGNVPTGGSDDEAARAAREQFREAGFDCPNETARNIVRHAWDSNR